MITFKQFLSEEDKQSRTKVISLDEAKELIDDHCSAWAATFKKTDDVLWRGVHAGDRVAFLGDSTQSRERHSANTQNYFTWFHDNSPMWAKYPKRARSFIGASDKETASSFGDTFIMVPYDNALVAALPEYDLFGAFKGLDPKHRLSHDADLAVFNDSIATLIRGLDLPKPTNYEEMVRVLKKLDRWSLVKTDEKKVDKDSVMHAYDIFNDTKTDNFFEAFKKLFTPARTKILEPGSSIPAGKEVYVQGKAVFLNSEDDDVQAYAQQMGWPIHGDADG
jgi:hypothetical protein